MMKYKKYLGSAEISMEDNILHGKLLHIRDLVTYEADSPEALEKAFREAVDYYISDCQEDGVEPEIPCKGNFNVRISPEIHRSLAISAHSKGCSLNEYVKVVLENHENNKNSPASTTHYHFNFAGRPKEQAARATPNMINMIDGKGGGSYYYTNPRSDINKIKVAKCH